MDTEKENLSPESCRVLEDFQVRKSKAQKAAFRDYLCGVLENVGYAPTVEKSRNGLTCENVIVGDPETASVIVSAHYDTCAVLPFPNFITPRNMLVYILFNLLICIGLFAVVFLAELVIFLLADDPSFLLTEAAVYIICFGFVWWMYFGKANKHTANDNTSGVITLIETALALPECDRDKVCFVFFDNEEKGLLGSSAFINSRKRVRDDTLNLNLDCVGDGSSIQLFPSKKLKADAETLERLESSVVGKNGRTVEIVRGFGFYPSDNRRFKRGVGICALRQNRVFGYYMSRIHTGRDTVLEPENVLLLRDGILRYAQTL